MQLSIYEPQFNWQEHVGAIFVVKIALTLLSSFEDLRLSKCDYELIESGWQTYWLQTHLRNVRIGVLSAAGLTKQQAWAKSSVLWATVYIAMSSSFTASTFRKELVYFIKCGEMRLATNS